MRQSIGRGMDRWPLARFSAPGGVRLLSWLRQAVNFASRLARATSPGSACTRCGRHGETSHAALAMPQQSVPAANVCGTIARGCRAAGASNPASRGTRSSFRSSRWGSARRAYDGAHRHADQRRYNLAPSQAASKGTARASRQTFGWSGSMTGRGARAPLTEPSSWTWSAGK